MHGAEAGKYEEHGHGSIHTVEAESLSNRAIPEGCAAFHDAITAVGGLCAILLCRSPEQTGVSTAQSVGPVEVSGTWISFLWIRSLRDKQRI
jgi:hypothetical protein